MLQAGNYGGLIVNSGISAVSNELWYFYHKFASTVLKLFKNEVFGKIMHARNYVLLIGNFGKSAGGTKLW
jgi:hypothetical protein